MTTLRSVNLQWELKACHGAKWLIHQVPTGFSFQELQRSLSIFVHLRGALEKVSWTWSKRVVLRLQTWNATNDAQTVKSWVSNTGTDLSLPKKDAPRRTQGESSGGWSNALTHLEQKNVFTLRAFAQLYEVRRVFWRNWSALLYVTANTYIYIYIYILDARSRSLK